MDSVNLDILALPPALPATVGALIDFADAMPRDLAVIMVARYCNEVATLIECGTGDATGELALALARYGIVLAVLLNRALFEILDLPQDRSHQIGLK